LLHRLCSKKSSVASILPSNKVITCRGFYVGAGGMCPLIHLLSPQIQKIAGKIFKPFKILVIIIKATKQHSYNNVHVMSKI